MSALELNSYKEEQKEQRINLRASAAVKNTLVRAAAVSGRSLSDFIVASALDAAHSAIENHERLSLSAEDREVFLNAIFNAPAPNKELRNAAKRYKQLSEQ